MKINNESFKEKLLLLSFACREIRDEQIKDALMIIGVSLVLQSSLSLRQYGSPISVCLFEPILQVFSQQTVRALLNAPFNSTRRQYCMHIASSA